MAEAHLNLKKKKRQGECSGNIHTEAIFPCNLNLKEQSRTVSYQGGLKREKGEISLLSSDQLKSGKLYVRWSVLRQYSIQVCCHLYLELECIAFVMFPFAQKITNSL